MITHNSQNLGEEVSKDETDNEKACKRIDHNLHYNGLAWLEETKIIPNNLF